MKKEKIKWRMISWTMLGGKKFVLITNDIDTYDYIPFEDLIKYGILVKKKEKDGKEK